MEGPEDAGQEALDRDYATMEGGDVTSTPALHRPARAPRRRARRLLWLRWYGFPKRSEMAWHLTQLGKHLRSLVGLRP